MAGNAFSVRTVDKDCPLKADCVKRGSAGCTENAKTCEMLEAFRAAPIPAQANSNSSGAHSTQEARFYENNPRPVKYPHDMKPCKVCGHIFKNDAQHFINGGNGDICRWCAWEKRKMKKGGKR